MTKTKFLTFITCMLIASMAQAETTIRDRSLHPLPYLFVLGGQGADVVTKRMGINEGGCHEGNQIAYGTPYPSVGRLLKVKAMGLAPSIGLIYLFQKTGHQKAARWTAAIAGSVGFGIATWNLALDCRPLSQR